MTTYDINKNQYILEPLIDKALLDSVTWVTKKCKNSPQEPDYVAALSIKFLKDLFNILVAVFPEYDFSILGVYCHQKPIVDIKLNKKPELGDILFVYADRREDRRKNREVILLNSLLLQAKVSKYSWMRVSDSEQHQLELYINWPEFTYYRAGYLNGKTRNIFPKSINDGAQYLLIDENPVTNGIYAGREMFPMGCAIPDDTLYINNSLSRELVNMLKFKSGRTFDKESYKTDDGWSKMIWDLLKIVNSKYSKRRNAGMESFHRKNECVHYYTENMGNRTLLDGIEGNEGVISYEEGVSVVLVESRLKTQWHD